MKSIKFLFVLLLPFIISACGGPSANSGTASGPGSDAQLLPEEWAGTYGGPLGKIMTLASDGSAHLYDLSSDETIDNDSSWAFEDERIIVRFKSYGYDLFANTEMKDYDVLIFNPEDPDRSQEPFVKISDEFSKLNKDDYLALMDNVVFHVEGLPSSDATGQTKDSAAETASLGGMEFLIPAYFQKVGSGGEDDLSYAVTDEGGPEILLSVIDAGTSLAEDEFRKEKYSLPEAYMKELGCGETRILDARNSEVGGQQARILTFYADTADYGPVHIRLTCINNAAGGRLLAAYLVQSLDTLHDYIEDFDRGLETASCTAADRPDDKK